MVDLTYLTLRDMFRMPIGKLRDVAAYLGVESPTTLSKSELVEVTYKAKCGVDIDNIPVRRGRPTKPAKGEYSIDWDNVPERNWTSEQIGESLGKFSKFNDNVAGYDIQDSNDKRVANDNSDLTNIIELGYLEIMDDGYGFTRSTYGKNSDAYVSSRLIRTVGLRKGDVLTGTARAQYEGKPYADRKSVV